MKLRSYKGSKRGIIAIAKNLIVSIRKILLTHLFRYLLLCFLLLLLTFPLSQGYFAIPSEGAMDFASSFMQGKRKKQNQDEWIPCILETQSSSKEYRKNWARLIQKIYEADPLTCPQCQGKMKIISFTKDEEVIGKILKHLGLWDLKARPPPKAKAPSVTISIDDSDSQVPFSAPSFYPDPDYRWIRTGFQNGMG